MPSTLGQTENHSRREQYPPYRDLQEDMYPQDGVDGFAHRLLREVLMMCVRERRGS